MTKIKKIGVLSLGKITGILYAIMGLIFGIIMAPIFMISFLVSTNDSGLLEALFAVGSIALLPIVYGIMGFVGGIISALVYNLSASWVGGIEIETE